MKFIKRLRMIYSISLPLFFSQNPFLSATPEMVSVPGMDQARSEAQACASISVDESQPVTNIQIRLADGGRLVQKFNHTHRYSIKMYCLNIRNQTCWLSLT